MYECMRVGVCVWGWGVCVGEWVCVCVHVEVGMGALAVGGGGERGARVCTYGCMCVAPIAVC